MNRTHTLLLSALSALALTAVTASAVEITVVDNDPRLWGFNNDGSLTQGGFTDGRGNLGIAKEDNETEKGTIGGQQWDMEAFVIKGNTLYIVGGFNMLNGVQQHNVGAGDLFIKVGDPTPGFQPTNPGSGDVQNSLYGYTHAVDLSMPNRFGNAAFGPTANAFSLNNNTWLHTVQNDQLGSNPWKYANNNINNAGTPSVATAITYTTGLASSHSLMTFLGLNHLVGSYHNVLSVDLSFLGAVAAGTQVYFSYTMECGNDSIKGRYSGGFDRVPDDVSSLLLIVAGLAALVFFAIRSRKLA